MEQLNSFILQYISQDTLDIILSVIVKGTQTDIKSLAQFNDILKNLDKSATMTLLVKRGDSQTFVTIKGSSDK